MVAYRVTIWDCVSKGHHKWYHGIDRDHSLAHERILYRIGEYGIKNVKDLFVNSFCPFLIINE